jgi:hypothetical protein
MVIQAARSKEDCRASTALLDCAGRRRSPRRDRRALAGRVRISEALALQGERSRPDTRRRAGAPWQGRQTARSEWTVGPGSSSSRGSVSATGGRVARFCVLRGPTRGRPCSPSGIRVQLRRAARAAGVPPLVRPTPAPEQAWDSSPCVNPLAGTRRSGQGANAVLLTRSASVRTHHRAPDRTTVCRSTSCLAESTLTPAFR